MIKSITIINPSNESLEMVLTDPDSSGFAIRSIEGLGPVKANLRLTELATLDGAIDNGGRLTTRNIVFSFVFMGTPTVEDTRLKSYKYFPIRQNIKIEIETDNRKVYTEGRVETNTPKIFGNEREGSQISILCPNSYFQDIDDTNITFSTLENNFTFPFSNESLTEPLIEFGNIINVSSANIEYKGDNETGMSIHMHITGPITNIGLQRYGTEEKLMLSDSRIESIIGSGTQPGDEIIMNTEKGNKSVYLIRNGINYNILNALISPINWLQLRTGDNVFTFSGVTEGSGIQYNVKFRNLYEGV